MELKLTRLAVGYLVTPAFLFFIYLHSILSFIAAASLCLLLYQLSKRRFFDSFTFTRETVLLVLFVSVSVEFLTGGFSWIYGLEQSDWVKHNTILFDLATKDWPITYSESSLNYFVGFYLPASVIGKVFGSYAVSKVALSIWTLLGLIFTLLYLVHYTKATSLVSVFSICFVFILYSGFDWLYFLIDVGQIPPFPAHLEWPSGLGMLQYPSFVTSLTWVPQHILPAFLIVPLLLNGHRYCWFLIPVLVIWSVFAALGALLLILIFTFNEIYLIRRIQIDYFLLLLCGLVSLPLLCFYALHHSTSFAPIFVPLATYLLFVTCELAGVILALLLVRNEVKKTEQLPIVVGVLTLLALPMFRFGENGYNDLVGRSCLPILVLLLFMVLKNISGREKPIAIGLPIALLLSGAITPTHEIGRVMQGQGQKAHLSSMEAFDAKFSDQYLGRAMPESSWLYLWTRPRGVFFLDRTSYGKEQPGPGPP